MVYGWFICRVAIYDENKSDIEVQPGIKYWLNLSLYFFSMCTAGYKARKGVVQCIATFVDRGMEWSGY